MNSLEVNATNRTAWAQIGLSAVEYSNGVGAHGLATGFGDTGSVGIGGITLAGGIGYLTREYGMTIDSVLGAELVTANGDVLEVNEKSHPDLFWAIRGGGGNFGVVTRFHYRLHQVPQIVEVFSILPATADSVVKVMQAAGSGARGTVGHHQRDVCSADAVIGGTAREAGGDDARLLRGRC